MSNFDFNFMSNSLMGNAGTVEFDYVMKALEAMEGITDSANLESVGALQPQSLEQIINHLQYRDSHFVLWNLVRPFMERARSTVEEYAQRISYGQSVGWVAQMQNPDEADPNFDRKHAFIKFLRQHYKVSDVAQQVESLSPALGEGKEAALKRLIATFTNSMYRGDSAMISESVDGFEKVILNQTSTDHVLDVRGALPTQQQFADLIGVIKDNYGETSDLKLLASTGGINQLGRIITEASANRQTWFYNVGPDGSSRIGTGVTKIDTQFGTVTPTADLFLSKAYENDHVPTTLVSGAVAEGRTSARAPLTPASVVVTAVADGSPVRSKWTDTDIRPSGVATGYAYRVAAGNQWGLSAATAASSPVTITAGQRMSIVITPTGGDPNPATYFVVYGEATVGKGALDVIKNFVSIGRVAASGVSAVTFYDYNEVIPGTTTAFILDLSTSGDGKSFGLRSLGGGIHSFPLAKTGPYEQGLVNFYFTPVYYQPRRFTMIRNMPVGRQATTLHPLFGM